MSTIALFAPEEHRADMRDGFARCATRPPVVLLAPGARPMGGQEDSISALAARDMGMVVLPAARMAEAARIRNKRGVSGASLVGLLAPEDVAQGGLYELMAAPLAEWDVLLCATEAERLAVKRLLEVVQEDFHERFGSVAPQPRLQVMPRSAEGVSGETRAVLRARMGVSQSATVILAETGRGGGFAALCKVLSGLAEEGVELWLPNASPETAAAAAALCPQIDVRPVVGDLASVMVGADIFAVASDSPDSASEEAVLMAMAAGLPVVAPNWGGLEELVQPERTGFLVPSYQTRPGAGETLATRLHTGQDSAAQHETLLSQHVAFDVPAFEDALRVLVRNAYLRKPMGAAAADYVQEHRSWGALVPRFEALAAELDAARPEFTPKPPRNRTFDAFDQTRGYSSHKLNSATQLACASVPSPEELEALDDLSGRTAEGRWIAGHAQLIWLAGQVKAHGPLSYGALCTAVSEGPGDLEGPLLLLAKYGFVTIGRGTS